MVNVEMLYLSSLWSSVVMGGNWRWIYFLKYNSRGDADWATLLGNLSFGNWFVAVKFIGICAFFSLATLRPLFESQCKLMVWKIREFIVV